MTWSIVARHPSGAFGVAVASKFFAVGALCPAVRNGKGALSTQALVNPLYARDGLAALDRGAPAQQVVRQLVEADAGRQVRQLHVVDASGNTAAHTGTSCIEWCGHLTRAGFSVAGNMLAGPQVIEETARVFEASRDLPFAEQLMAAMEAGEAAGGDKRGKQGAALVIHTTEDYPYLDIRVDDHADPLAELRRLHEVSLERFQAFMGCLPSAAEPAGITDRSVIEERIARFHATRAGA
jgi:uncharacterized Ntn-hydrolase superfamily protein